MPVMIKLIQIFDENVIPKDHYGRRLCALYTAYGLEYDFCRFYAVSKNSEIAFAVIINDCMILSSDGFKFCDELEDFIRLYMPYTIEFSPEIALNIDLDGYISRRRIMFEFSGCNNEEITVVDNPNLDEIFQILVGSFHLSNKQFPIWLTDCSHQLRHGVIKIFKYNETTATRIYMQDGICFFGMVATSRESRGKGNGRKLLRWLNVNMKKEGYSSQLCSFYEMASYYRELGFTEIGKDILFEREI